jgi:2-octaprenylphenol hydroxylase
MRCKFDICVIGNGIVGLTAALIFAKTGKSVCVVDSLNSNARKQGTERHFSLSVASKEILSSAGVWEDLLSTDHGVVNSIETWEEGEVDRIRFDLPDRFLLPMSWIFSEQQLLRVLRKHIDRMKISTVCCPISSDTSIELGAPLLLEDGTLLESSLTVVADGRNSPMRSLLGIRFRGKDFGQSAIVANVMTEGSHDNIARQCFLSKGPLAFLPLKENFQSSIVWSVPSHDAIRLLELDPQQFRDSLGEALNFTLGAILDCTSVLSFPLEYGVASSFVKNNFALVGGAAHAFHPLAGQGLNLGLLDIATLLQCTMLNSESHYQCLYNSLRRYHGWRKGEALKMIAVTTGLNSIYARDTPSVKLLRRFGARFLGSRRPLKDYLIESAMGLRGDIPDIVKVARPF